jgi:hypothetical protein
VFTGVQVVVCKPLPAVGPELVQLATGAVPLIVAVEQVVAVHALPAAAATGVQEATAVGPVVIIGQLMEPATGVQLLVGV